MRPMPLRSTRWVSSVPPLPPTRTVSPNLTSRRCGSHPTAPSATSWVALSFASPSLCRTCLDWCPGGRSPLSLVVTPTLTSTRQPTLWPSRVVRSNLSLSRPTGLRRSCTRSPTSPLTVVSPWACTTTTSPFVTLPTRASSTPWRVVNRCTSPPRTPSSRRTMAASRTSSRRFTSRRTRLSTRPRVPGTNTVSLTTWSPLR
mmetsp:Transcript_6035/g.19710  ORF Transcript_6035/g.19710 Transcript_6035/m.19710 type:complete len:201 (-) Transcript_6035:125-727(-)